MTSYFNLNRSHDDYTTTDRKWTAEEHRVQARRLLSRADYSDAQANLAAALVHATLAVSLADHKHTHGPVT